MNSEDIARELKLVLLRSRAGLVSADRSTQEVAILRAMLQARGQAQLESKLDALQAAIEARNEVGQGRQDD